MDRYPRRGAPYPDLIPALLCPAGSFVNPPASVEVVVREGTKELCYIQIAQIAAIAAMNGTPIGDTVSGKAVNFLVSGKAVNGKAANGEAANGGPWVKLAALWRAAEKYLAGPGDSSELFQAAGVHLRTDILISGRPPTHTPKRAGTDKVLEFERRLDAYASKQPHPTETLSAVGVQLKKLGLQSPLVGPEVNYLPDGRARGTSAEMLSRALKNIPDAAMRASCTGNFEMLASQIWGWRYPLLDDGARERVLASFRVLQGSLSKKSGGDPAGCHNVTIRLLWHFAAAGFPCPAEMFRLPVGRESWNNNLLQIEVSPKWRPGLPPP